MHSQSITFRQSIGAAVRHSRKEAGLTQVQLADKSGVDRSFLSDVELGKKGVTTDYLYWMALAMGTSVSRLSAQAERLYAHANR